MVFNLSTCVFSETRSQEKGYDPYVPCAVYATIFPDTYAAACHPKSFLFLVGAVTSNEISFAVTNFSVHNIKQEKSEYLLLSLLKGKIIRELTLHNQ